MTKSVYSEMSVADLKKKSFDLKNEVIILMMQKNSGTLKDVSKIRKVRREKARVLTELNKKSI
ncbi:MAG: 50S ribosomal protein L29 [Rickettsiales bacterium]|nr:50S ribosomal protein L29 [Rickettsiales bacterium]